MKKLTITTRWGLGRRAHHHIVYINEDTGQGAASADQFGNTHEVIFQPPTPEQPEYQDPATGQIMPAKPGSPGGWFLSPDPEDGHTHDLEESYEIDVKQKKEEDSQVIRDVLELWRTAGELESDSIEAGHESEGFFTGENQWTDEDKAYLKSLDRACLTINLIAPKINEISGHQRQGRTDIHYVPVEGGDQRACDMYNVVAKVISNGSNLDREESKAFMDTLITGRGWINLFSDHSKNILGDLRLQRFPWDRVRVGPHEQEDLEDCEYLCKDRMYSKGKLEQLWPDKADDIGKDFEAFYDLKDRHPQYAGDNYAIGDGTIITMGGETLVDIAKKEYRVIECWRRVWIDATVAVHAGDEHVQSLYGWDRKDVKLVETIPGFAVIPRSEQKMRISKIAGGILLSDENPADLPVDDFYMVPIYAYKRGHKFYGVVENAKDPQREVNKRRSQAIDIVNRTSADGWGYDAGTFSDENEARKFRLNSTKPGFVVQLSDVNRPPHKFDGSRFPSEMVNLMNMDIENLDRLLSISIREPGANTSAAAIMQAQKMKLIGNEFLFDNLTFAKRKEALLLLPTIQRYYSPERIYRIVSDQNARKQVLLGGQPFEAFTVEEITDILSNVDITKMDVAVSESSFSPTVRIAILTMLQEWAASGGPVPPQMLVKYFDVPDEERQEMLQDIQAQQDAQAQAAQSAQDAEIVKSIIPRGFPLPPAYQQRLYPDGMQADGAQSAQPPSEISPTATPQGVSEY